MPIYFLAKERRKGCATYRYVFTAVEGYFKLSDSTISNWFQSKNPEYVYIPKNLQVSEKEIKENKQQCFVVNQKHLDELEHVFGELQRPEDRHDTSGLESINVSIGNNEIVKFYRILQLPIANVVINFRQSQFYVSENAIVFNRLKNSLMFGTQQTKSGYREVRLDESNTYIHHIVAYTFLKVDSIYKVLL
jgi:hypothetical protein